MNSTPSGPAWRDRFSQPALSSRISAMTLARVAGSFSRSIHFSSPPACTQVGMAASSPVAPAV